MFSTLRYLLVAFVLLVFGPVPAVMAQQSAASTGFIEGHLDGQPKRWLVSLDRNLPTATLSTIAPGIHRVRINGYRNERFSRAGSVLIEFTLRESDDGWRVHGTEIRYFPFEAQHPRFSFGGDHGRGGVQVQSFEIEPVLARLSAEVSATLFYHQSPNTRPISQHTEEIALDIDLTLIRN